MLDYTYVRPYSWTNPLWPHDSTHRWNNLDNKVSVRGGDRVFTDEEVKLIKIWRDRDGWGGLTLEEFFEGINDNQGT